MAALDFPSSPTDGQVFDNWIYSSSKGAWQSKPVEISLPAGIITQYAGTTAPTGYLMCQGQAVSRSTYAALFTALGTTYGTGDGSTTFNLPDLQGRVPVGKNGSGTFASLNTKGGAETHTLTEAQMPSHTHTASTNTTGAHTHSGSTSTNGSHTHNVYQEYGGIGDSNMYPGNGYKAQFANWNAGTKYVTSWPVHYSGDHSHSFTTGSSGDHSHTVTVNSTGSGAAHNILQPYIVVNYIIKT